MSGKVSKSPLGNSTPPVYSTNYRAASEAECQSDTSDTVYPVPTGIHKRSHGNTVMTGYFVKCPKG